VTESRFGLAAFALPRVPGQNSGFTDRDDMPQLGHDCVKTFGSPSTLGAPHARFDAIEETRMFRPTSELRNGRGARTPVKSNNPLMPLSFTLALRLKVRSEAYP
jgi:hypothetical protein